MRWILLVLCAAAAFAQGTEPKAKPGDYPVHAEAGGVGLGAEFMVHSFSRGEESYIAEYYLVVEVALFPPKGKTLQVNLGEFTLRVNGRKRVLVPQAPQMAATSLRHPEWQTGQSIQAGAGIGDVGVTVGGPPVNRNPFPGAPPVSRLPNPPRAPDPNTPPGVEPRARVQADELLVQTALSEGECHGPVSGFLYFPYQGKTKSIKSVDLLYGDAVLKLR
jgi:hypothetical protein